MAKKVTHHRTVHHSRTVEDEPEDNNEEQEQEAMPEPQAADQPVVTPFAVPGGTGNSTGTTSLTMSAVTGTIQLGATVLGTGVPANTVIVSQTSGTTGGNGVYVTNNATTLTAVALTFMSPVGGVRTERVGIDQAGNLWYLGISGWYYLATTTLPVPQSQD
jgi:hypothetical protein